jgi:hypothetical protein
VELAARRPQPAMGEFKMLALSILDIASIDRISRHQAMILARLQTPTPCRALPRKSFARNGNCPELRMRAAVGARSLTAGCQPMRINFFFAPWPRRITTRDFATPK